MMQMIEAHNVKRVYEFAPGDVFKFPGETGWDRVKKVEFFNIYYVANVYAKEQEKSLRRMPRGAKYLIYVQ